MTTEDIVKTLFRSAGVRIRVSSDTFYSDLLSGSPSLILGEAYIRREVQFPDGIYESLRRLYSISEYSISDFYSILGVERAIFLLPYLVVNPLIAKLRSLISNHQTESRSPENVGHYNLSHVFYRSMLGDTMQYSCALFKSPEETLDQAQKNKIERIVTKLKLSPGMKLLEIGSGYGYLSNFIHCLYSDCHITGVNISTEQLKYSIREYPDVTFVNLDYRNITGEYDRIYSVGMFEHVGKKNYRDFFSVVEKSLTPGGVFVLHTITAKKKYIDSTDPFLDKYIFPGGMIPHMTDILEATDLKLEHVEDFGLSYSETLKRWKANLNETHQSGKLLRMFEYYLDLCRVGFDVGNLTLKQYVFTKNWTEIYRISD